MDTPPDLARELGHAAVKVAPPAAVLALPPNELLAWVSIAYVLMQTAYLVWKWRREWRRRSRLHDA